MQKLLFIVYCTLLSLLIYGCNIEAAAWEDRIDIRHDFNVEKVLRFLHESRQKVTNLQSKSVPGFKEDNSCSCHNYSCECCLHAEVKRIYLNDTVCIKISYLPDELGMEIDLILDGRVLFKRKISVKNPPPICAEIPYVHKLASLCIRVFNISLDQNRLFACMGLEVELDFVIIKEYLLGCFHIPPALYESHHKTNKYFSFRNRALPLPEFKLRDPDVNRKPSYIKLN